MNAPQTFIDKIWKQYKTAQNSKIDKIIEGILYVQPEAFEFMEKVRKGFYCYICDFENHKYIDIVN